MEKQKGPTILVQELVAKERKPGAVPHLESQVGRPRALSVQDLSWPSHCATWSLKRTTFLSSLAFGWDV